jgi:hypothetical protein
MMTIFVNYLRCVAIAAGLFVAWPAVSQSIPPIPTGHPRILLVGAELQRLKDDLNNNVTYATRFRDMVDSAVGGASIYDYKPWYSAMIGVIRGNATYPQYCAHAVNLTESFVASEEAVIATGQRATVSYDVYLEVGDLVGNVMLVYDWCHGVLTPLQRTRWLDYSSRAVTNIWDPDHAQWGGVSHPWNGWSINNPVNNYYYSFLRATMLYGVAAKHDRSDADTWLTMFRTTKLNNQLAPLFNSDLVGGGSREGTGYGTAMKGLFNLYYLWEKTTGERIADLTTHTNASMPYLIHSMMPTRDRIAPIGDHARDSTATFYDYQRESLIALATLYRGTAMARRVRAELALSSVPVMHDSFNIVYDYFYGGADAGTAANLNTVYRGSGTGHLFARSAWTGTATWLGFLAGPYTESHAHPDGLSLLLFKNGWLVNDANMQSHSGIQNVQEAHALVTQRVGGNLLPMYETATSSAQLTALSHRPLYLYAAANQGSLFTHPNNGNPGVQSKREIVFLKPDIVVVFDRVQYTPGTSVKTFQLPTPYLPTISGRTASFSNGTSSLRLHAVAPAGAALSSIPMSTVDADFEGGYRIDVAVTGSGETKFMNVLSIDNAAATVTGSPTDSGEVGIALADGRSVLLRFNAAAPGGTIEIRDGSGQVLVSEPLAGTVEAIPVTIPTQEVLTVSKSGAGAGSVSSLPAGIVCGSTCNAVFDSDTVVTLSATPNPGSTFTGWSGGGCAGTGNCQITITAATAVTAAFALVPPMLPDAPTVLAGIPGSQRITVSFAPPASNGGSPVTGYILSCTSGLSTVTAGGPASPLVVTGLTNGTPYDCSVAASNSVGTGPSSSVVSVTPAAGAPLTLVGVQSRKLHGAASFDLPIDFSVAIGGAISVEPRSIGAGHVIVFQFSEAINAAGTVSAVNTQSVPVGSPVSSPSGNEVQVTLTGVPDNSRVAISLSAVNGTGNAGAAIGFLVGDVNGSRSVNASDISGVKARSGQTADSGNFRFDLNASGSINATDISAVKARSGLVLP